jgi:hypothetical protein
MLGLDHNKQPLAHLQSVGVSAGYGMTLHKLSQQMLVTSWAQSWELTFTQALKKPLGVKILLAFSMNLR